MDTNSNEEYVRGTNSNHNRSQQYGDHDYDPEIPTASISISDPGPNYSSSLSRNQVAHRGRRSGHHGRNQTRAIAGHVGTGFESLEHAIGNRPRSMYTTTSTPNEAGDFAPENTHPPRKTVHFNITPQGNSEENIPSQSGRRQESQSQNSLFRQPNPRTAISFMDQGLAWNIHGEAVSQNYLGGTVNPRGYLSLRINPDVRIDLTANRAIRIQDDQLKVIMALSGSGNMSALIHPAGCVYQYGSRVEISVRDRLHNENKIAKMWHKGISFTSDNAALIYLVDSAGIRTTNDVFSDLSGDISYPVFTEESLIGAEHIQRCMEYLREGSFWIGDDGSENWIFNGIRISCSTNGSIRVARGNTKFTFRTAPNDTGAFMTTPFIYATGSLGPDWNLFVKRGERRLHYDGKSFAVRNGGQSAGYDFRNKLKVF